MYKRIYEIEVNVSSIIRIQEKNNELMSMMLDKIIENRHKIIELEKRLEYLESKHSQGFDSPFQPSANLVGGSLKNDKF